MVLCKRQDQTDINCEEWGKKVTAIYKRKGKKDKQSGHKKWEQFDCVTPVNHISTLYDTGKNYENQSFLI